VASGAATFFAIYQNCIEGVFQNAGVVFLTGLI
jgi:hypothetical protein